MNFLTSLDPELGLTRYERVLEASEGSTKCEQMRPVLINARQSLLELDMS